MGHGPPPDRQALPGYATCAGCVPKRSQAPPKRRCQTNARTVITGETRFRTSSVSSGDRNRMVDNVVALVETAKLYEIPIVLSTVNVAITGDAIPALQSVLAGVRSIDRSTINAWEDRSGVPRGGEGDPSRKLIIAALWTEACLLSPTLDALRDGYDVYPWWTPWAEPTSRRTTRLSRGWSRPAHDQRRGSRPRASCNAIGAHPDSPGLCRVAVATPGRIRRWHQAPAGSPSQRAGATGDRMIAGWTQVSSASELLRAVEQKNATREVQGTVRGMPTITLPPDVRLRGGTFEFGAKGVRLTRDKVLEDVVIRSPEHEIAILDDRSIADFGTLTLRGVRTVARCCYWPATPFAPVTCTWRHSR